MFTQNENSYIKCALEQTVTNITKIIYECCNNMPDRIHENLLKYNAYV